MRFTVLAAGLCLVGACQPDSTGSPFILSPSDARTPLLQSSALIFAPREFSPREAGLVDRVVAMFPGQRGGELRNDLLDSRVFAIRVTGHPEAQAILDQIAQMRQWRRDSALAAAKASNPRTVTVTLGLMDTWQYGSAAAVLLVRPGRDPANMILLPPTARAGNLAGAVVGLVGLYKRGAVSDGHDIHVVVGDTAMPASWRREGLDLRADHQLASLKQTPAVDVRGVGHVRIGKIPVVLR